MQFKKNDHVRFIKDCFIFSDDGGTVIKNIFYKGTVAILGADCDENDMYIGGYKIPAGYLELIKRKPYNKPKKDKHNILHDLIQTDGSIDGEKLIKKLEENQVQVANGVVMNDKPQRPTESASTPDDKTKGSHYEKAAMQPLEVMQRVMTQEQFEAFLFGNCLKYLLRKDYKGQRESDEYKARQYAYWLEMAKEGRIINPSKDKVPIGYEYKGVII